jgi:23S rRNA-/tRNA-specific pseudouridylate synthase
VQTAIKSGTVTVNKRVQSRPGTINYPSNPFYLLLLSILFTKKSMFVNYRYHAFDFEGALLNAGDLVEMEAIQQNNGASEIPPIKVDFPIIFEDEHLVVIDKPHGLLSHPVNFANNPVTPDTEATVLHGLIEHCGIQVELFCLCVIFCNSLFLW